MRYFGMFASCMFFIQLFAGEMGQELEIDDEIRVESLLEKNRQPPLKQSINEGKIIRKDSSIEWQSKIGNVDVTISAENTEPHDQWKAEWENRISKRLSDGKAKNEPKSTSPVRFSMRWSSDD